MNPKNVERTPAPRISCMSNIIISNNNSRVLNYFLLTIYTTINLLFIWKYAPDYGLPVWPIMTVFVALASVVVWFFDRILHLKPILASKAMYHVLTICMALSFFYILHQFNPDEIRVGRYPSIYDWLSRLSHNQFPYQSSTNPSGFPFLYILALPFYLLGDIGYLQIISFFLFAWLIFKFNSEFPESRLKLLLLLIISPSFLYEIVVRSELFSNMVFFLIYALLIRNLITGRSSLTTAIAGLLGGFILSTRGIIFPLLLLLIPVHFRSEPKKLIIFGLSLIAGFFLTLVPFLAWNLDYFLTKGPFAIQSSYLPKILILISIVLAMVWGLKNKNYKDFVTAAATFLFITVAVAFSISVTSVGFCKAVRGDFFDISYFCFTLPFLLLALGDDPFAAESDSK